VTDERPDNDRESPQEEKRNGQIAEAVQKSRRSNQAQTEAMPSRCRPGEVSRIMMQMLAIAHWPEIDTDNAQQVSERIHKYHCFCAEQDLKPSVVGMALAIGTDRITMWKWEHGIESSKPQDVRNAIRKGREINEMMMVHLLQNGRVSPATAIFLLKNDHGYKDQQDVVISPTSPYDSASQEELAQRYLDGTVQTDGSVE
jgi:hypothetical protein